MSVEKGTEGGAKKRNVRFHTPYEGLGGGTKNSQNC